MKNDPAAAHISEDLRAYLDGDLPEERRRAVDGHLEECSDCRAELGALEALGSLEGGALTSQERADLRAAIWERRGATVVPLRRRARFAKALGAVAAVALLAVSAAYLGSNGLGVSGSDSGGEGAAIGEQEGADVPEERRPRGDRRALDQATTDKGTGATEGGGGESAGSESFASPEPTFADRAESLSRNSLKGLAKEEPLTTYSNYSRTLAREQAAGNLDVLADKAPDETTARTVRSCGRRIILEGPALPAYATTGRLDGKDVLVLGFATADEGGSVLDRFLVVAYEIGVCAREVERVGGSLDP